MATLEQTLTTFTELLGGKQAASIGAVDEAIWDYLSAEQGLTAQTAALDELTKEVPRLNPSSPFMPILMDTIDRHRKRLTGSPS